MQNRNRMMSSIGPAARGQMVITLEPHGYNLYKLCIPIRF